MIIKSVIQVGNPIIRKRSKNISNIDTPLVKKIIKDLTDTMRHSNLVGMAAPQIGYNLKIFVTEIRKTQTRKIKDLDQRRVFINPKITKISEKKVTGYEGCGSVAFGDIFGKVLRPNQVVIEAINEKGDKIKLTAKGLLARIIQHENDHLNGIIFLDKITDTKSLMSGEEYIKKYRK